MKDQKLFIESNEWFAEIGNNYPALKKEYIGLEPTKIGQNKAKTEAITSVRTRWLRGLDSNQDSMVQNHVAYH